MCYKIIFTALIVSFAVMLAGCRGASQETDDVAFVTAIGIDQAEEDKIKVTYELMIPRAVGGIQGVGQEVPGGPTITNSVVAPNMSEARNLLSSSMSRVSNLSHMRSLIIGEALARSGGLGDIISAVKRYREFRGGMFIMIVHGKAEDFMTANKPKLDYLPTKFYESFIKSGDETGYHLRTDVHDFYLRLKNPGGSPYAVYVGTNPLTGEDKPAGPKLPNDPANPYLAGKIPKTGKENTEFAGTAIFSGTKMVGILDTKETRILAMLQNRLTKSIFTIADPLEPDKHISLFIRNGSKPKINTAMTDGQAVITVNVFLEGEITGIPSGINYEESGRRELVEEELSQLVKEETEGFIAHTQELGSDVFGFGYYLRRNFTTYREIREINLAQLYKTAQVDIQVTTKLRRMGLMWRTTPYAPTTDTE